MAMNDVIESTYGEICEIRLWKIDGPGHEHVEDLQNPHICCHCGAHIQRTDRGPRTIYYVEEWP